MRKSLALCFFLSVLFLGCSEEKTKEATAQLNLLNNEIDGYIHHMMKTHEVPGMAVAVVQNDSLIHSGYYGSGSLRTKEPITNKTVFKIFSLTKTMVAISVFKLIEEGKISLEDKLLDYLDDLPEKWQTVTVANLLSHSSGLPDVIPYVEELQNDSISDRQFIRLLYNDEMDFKTGEEWSYNQTNYILLRLIIEKTTKAPFMDHIIKHQFRASDSTGVFFSSDPDKPISNLTNYYQYDHEVNKFKKKTEFSGNKNLPLAGMNLTLEEYIGWNDRLDKNLLVSERTKKLMWTPFAFSKTDRHFLHGWDVYEVNGHDSFGFSGGGVSGFRKFLEKDLSIIVLTTGYRHYSVQDIIIDHIAGIVDPSLKDEESDLKELITAKYFLSSDSLDLRKIVTTTKLENPDIDLEPIFKSLGYRLFFEFDRKKDAIALFEANVLEYPESYDTHGSLAYLQFLTDQFEISRKNYVKAQKLNPENTYSERMIERIDELTK